MKLVRRYGVLCLAMVAILGIARVATAAMELDIVVKNLKFSYDRSQNGSLYDGKTIAGGRGNIAEATAVGNIDFIMDGGLVGTLDKAQDPLYCDFLIGRILNIPAGGATPGNPLVAQSDAAGFTFDLLSASRGRFLQLDFRTAKITFTGIGLRFSFVADTSSAAMVYQNLPFGLNLDPGLPVSINITGLVASTATPDGQYVQSFYATSGQADVNGIDPPAVPEPASFAVLLAFGVLAMEVLARRKRRALGPSHAGK
jgi:hypothetical protein